jgi:broad specificity phosphatase PhoE
MPVLSRFLLSTLAAAVLVVMPAAAHAQVTTVVLVRHAEKAAAPAADPVLTAEGMARAAELATVLADWGTQAIITTPTERTRATAAPLAARLGLTPRTIAPAGSARDHAADVARQLLAAHTGQRVLVVGHSNTVPAIIAALGGPSMPDLCDTEYARMFVLEIPAAGAPRLLRTWYGTPDAPVTPDCNRRM